MSHREIRCELSNRVEDARKHNMTITNLVFNGKLISDELILLSEGL